MNKIELRKHKTEIVKRWRERNPEKSREQNREYKKRNKEKIHEYNVEYYRKNRDTEIARTKAYREKKAEKLNKQ